MLFQELNVLADGNGVHKTESQHLPLPFIKSQETVALVTLKSFERDSYLKMQEIKESKQMCTKVNPFEMHIVKAIKSIYFKQAFTLRGAGLYKGHWQNHPPVSSISIHLLSS